MKNKYLIRMILLVLAAAVGFIVLLCCCGIAESPFIAGKIACGIIGILMLAMGAAVAVKIHRNDQKG